MAVYEYKALDRKGKTLKGVIEADSKEHARSTLRKEKKYITEIKENSGKSSLKSKGRFNSPVLFERIKSEEIHVITRQIATLLGANIPLLNSLDSVMAQSVNPGLKKVLAQIKTSVNEGNTLATALSQHPKLFSSIYINMVRAGETSGSLDIVLERLADFGEKQQALQGRLKAALVYPAFMAVIGTGILFLLITYIVPNITKVFDDMERALPLPTRILISVSDFLRGYWWLLAIILVLAFMGISFFAKSETGQRFFDNLKLRLPIIGSVTQKVALARFSSTLGSLLGSSVPLDTSIQIVKSIVNNSIIAEVIDNTTNDIREGKSMATSLSASRWFPPIFVQMLTISEQSGDPEPILEKMAATYEREVDTAVMAMTSLIEPVMIAGMGATVGFIVLSILLPIFEMNQMVG